MHGSIVLDSCAPQDVTEDEFVAFMQKCGIVAVDALNGTNHAPHA